MASQNDPSASMSVEMYAPEASVQLVPPLAAPVAQQPPKPVSKGKPRKASGSGIRTGSGINQMRSRKQTAPGMMLKAQTPPVVVSTVADPLSSLAAREAKKKLDMRETLHQPGAVPAGGLPPGRPPSHRMREGEQRWYQEAPGRGDDYIPSALASRTPRTPVCNSGPSVRMESPSALPTDPGGVCLKFSQTREQLAALNRENTSLVQDNFLKDQHKPVTPDGITRAGPEPAPLPPKTQSHWQQDAEHWKTNTAVVPQNAGMRAFEAQQSNEALWPSAFETHPDPESARTQWTKQKIKVVPNRRKRKVNHGQTHQAVEKETMQRRTSREQRNLQRLAAPSSKKHQGLESSTQPQLQHGRGERSQVFDDGMLRTLLTAGTQQKVWFDDRDWSKVRPVMGSTRLGTDHHTSHAATAALAAHFHSTLHLTQPEANTPWAAQGTSEWRREAKQHKDITVAATTGQHHALQQARLAHMWRRSQEVEARFRQRHDQSMQRYDAKVALMSNRRIAYEDQIALRSECEKNRSRLSGRKAVQAPIAVGANGYQTYKCTNPGGGEEFYTKRSQTSLW